LIEYLEAFGNNMFEEYEKELRGSAHCLKTLGKTIEQIFENKGGRAIICTSIHKEKGNEVVKYESKEKVPTFKPKIDTFTKLG
jgi:hypothetical protein